MTNATYLSGVLQVKAYRILQAKVADETKRFDINPTQWFIIGQLKDNQSIRATDLAGLLKVDPPLITSLTDDLVAKGVIQKQQHTKDKRVNILKLTSNGTKLVLELEKRLQSVLGMLLKGLKTNELNAYEKVLSAIVQNADSQN